jgi:hypothetical protein
MLALEALEAVAIAWYDPTNHHVSTDKHDPLFTPLGQLWPLCAKREWVGLTDEQMYEAVRPLCDSDQSAKFLISVSKDEYQAIEAAIKERNL